MWNQCGCRVANNLMLWQRLTIRAFRLACLRTPHRNMLANLTLVDPTANQIASIVLDFVAHMRKSGWTGSLRTFIFALQSRAACLSGTKLPLAKALPLLDERAAELEAVKLTTGAQHQGTPPRLQHLSLLTLYLMSLIPHSTIP